MSAPIEIRCPVYGFIELDDWERDIISQPAFQRLRRIRQLAWTDVVYPGAMHTRFEHSLGVMQMATRLFDSVKSRSAEILRSEYGYNDDGFGRYRRLVRLAALLHDVGHGPFSHAVESLAPERTYDSERLYAHEDYSTEIIRRMFKDMIEDHPSNRNYGFKIEDVASLIEGINLSGDATLWRDLVSGQLDGDRMDYLIRDAYHTGVDYGKYDWRRLIASVELVEDPETGDYRFGISGGGRHVAESLIIARYMMFNQVYFHKVRTIADHHLHHAVAAVLPGGKLPPPTADGLQEYLSWDDWRVLGAFAAGEGGEHAECLKERKLFKLVWETPEFPSDDDLEMFEQAHASLEGLDPVVGSAAKSWYKVSTGEDLLVKPEHRGERTTTLSRCSAIVGGLKPSRRQRLYVPGEVWRDAAEKTQNIRGRSDGEAT